eukprot:TRINITY_DN534_c0_g2_i1.p1 TRINITY_DN534_c0_g2~~TRINITY_DN534_c0_g2_i1.p1  ORF type:complete len:824 (-),score=189.65 TRINITY_DN534_c0_g2_i1:278-2425(-)
MMETYVFETNDLYQERNMVLVLENVAALRKLHTDGVAPRDPQSAPNTPKPKRSTRKPSNLGTTSAPATPAKVSGTSSAPATPSVKTGSSKRERTSRAGAMRSKVSSAGMARAPTDNSKERSFALARSNSIAILTEADQQAIKKQLQYDPELERSAQKWIEDVCETKLPPGTFADGLKSGLVLCKLANTLKPGSINPSMIKNTKMAYIQRENIAHFLTACRKELGVNPNGFFSVSDLFEERDMNVVVKSIHVLARHVSKWPGYDGPKITEDKSKTSNLFSASLMGDPSELPEIVNDKPLTESQEDIVEWANEHLASIQPPLDSSFSTLGAEVRDGLLLIHLLQAVSREPRIGAYHKSPSTMYHFMQNATMIFSFIRNRTFEVIEGCVGQDIVMGNREAIASLLTLIRAKFDRDFMFQEILNAGLDEAEDEGEETVEEEVSELSITKDQAKDSSYLKSLGLASAQIRDLRASFGLSKEHRSSSKANHVPRRPSQPLPKSSTGRGDSVITRPSRPSLPAPKPKVHGDGINKNRHMSLPVIPSKAKSKKDRTKSRKLTSSKSSRTHSHSGSSSSSRRRKRKKVVNVKVKVEAVAEKPKMNDGKATVRLRRTTTTRGGKSSSINVIQAQFKMRAFVVTEILSTEVSYFDNLSLMQSEVAVPAREILNQEEFAMIFSNLHQLITSHKDFLAILKQRIGSWDDTKVIGDIFLHKTGFLKQYD